MFSGFQSNSFQTGFQIVRDGVPPPETNESKGLAWRHSEEDVRRYKKYLQELEEYRQSKLEKPKKKRGRPKKNKKPEQIRALSIDFAVFDAKLADLAALDAEIARIEALILQRQEFIEMMRLRDDEEAIWLLLQ